MKGRSSHGPDTRREAAPIPGTAQGRAPSRHHPKAPGPALARATLRDAVAELLALQEHWRRCLDALPEALHDTPYGERLQAMAETDIEILQEIEPPLGYGRDT